MKDKKDFGFECEGGIDRRTKIHCEMVISMNAKFSDFMERYERDREMTNSFRIKVEKSLENLQEDIAKLRPPVRVGIWIAVTAIGASIIASFSLAINKIISKLVQ